MAPFHFRFRTDIAMRATKDQSTPDQTLSAPPPRWKAWFLLVVVFALGSASSIGVGAIWLRSKVKTALKDPYSVEGLPLQRMARIESRLARELDLSDDQKARLREAFENAEQNYEGIRVRFLDELQGFSKTTYREIEKALPPEKRSDFRALAAKGAIPWVATRETDP